MLNLDAREANIQNANLMALRPMPPTPTLTPELRDRFGLGLIFLMCFYDFGGELGPQRLQKESPKSHASVEDSSWKKHGSNMKQKGAKS